jgi:hypothetical protein
VEDKIAELSSKGFGSWAEDQLLRDYGQGLTQMADNAEFDFRHEASRVRIELKAARHKRDAFRFAYIRPTSFELCVCLGYHNSSHHYWLFDSTEIQGFLAHQHRGGDTFQLRIRLADERFQSYYSSRDQVRIALDPKATTVARHRNLVRLDPVLESIEGWHSVAAAISRRLEKGASVIGSLSFDRCAKNLMNLTCCRIQSFLNARKELRRWYIQSRSTLRTRHGILPIC